MSSTNKTANYELSQFVGTDIPSILSDYNGDMRKIDAGIAEVATSAGSSASSISALAGRVTTAENSITTLNGTVDVVNQRSVQNQNAITGIQGVIPNDASVNNKLVTENDIPSVPSIAGLESDVADIKAVIPSSASTSNKLATMADIGGSITGTIQKLAQTRLTITDYSSWTEFISALNSAILTLQPAGNNPNHNIEIYVNISGDTVILRPNSYQPYIYTGFTLGPVTTNYPAKFTMYQLDIGSGTNTFLKGTYLADSQALTDGKFDFSITDLLTSAYPNTGFVDLFVDVIV